MSGIVAIDRGSTTASGWEQGPVRPCTLDPRPQPSRPSSRPRFPFPTTAQSMSPLLAAVRQVVFLRDRSLVPRAAWYLGDSTRCSSTGTGFTCKVPLHVPPAPRYRTASPSGGSLPCSPATWVCSSRKRWVTPSSPSPLSYPPLRRLSRRSGKLGSSRAITEPSSHTARETETLGTEGSQPHVPAPWFPTPGLPAGWFGVMCDTPALTTHQPWRRPGISHLHCLADFEIQAPDAEK